MTSELNNRSILLIIGGGIAAYKALELIRRIKGAGADVRVVLTKGGAEFVTPLSVSVLSENQVFTDLFDVKDEAEIGHIQLSREADLIVVVPATADLLAKMTHGLANDLATSVLLATDKPVLVAPAMNVRMWEHAATQRNVAQLKSDGVSFVGPEEGAMACGEYGPGRMSEVPDIVSAIGRAIELADTQPLQTQSLPNPNRLAGKHVLITTGPTHEAIDPVRYLANRSSGKQGFAIAQAAKSLGARVTLVSGPTTLDDPHGVFVDHVQSAKDMLAAVKTGLPADIVICAAAVADWGIDGSAKQKIKKKGKKPKPPKIKLKENPDILKTVSNLDGADGHYRPGVVIGFAAETNDVVAHAKKKLKKKGCDLIVANDVSPESGVMGGDENTVHLVSKDGVRHWPKMSKSDVALWLMDHAADLLDAATPDDQKPFVIAERKDAAE